MIQLTPVSLFVVVLVSAIVGAELGDRLIRLFVRLSGSCVSYGPGCKVCGISSGCCISEKPACLSCMEKRSEKALAEMDEAVAEMDRGIEETRAYLRGLEEERSRLGEEQGRLEVAADDKAREVTSLGAGD